MDECKITSLCLSDSLQPLGILSNSHSSPVTKRKILKRMTEVASLGLLDDIQPVRFQAHLLDEAYSLVTKDCEVV